jgi:hypothetical protein
VSSKELIQLYSISMIAMRLAWSEHSARAWIGCVKVCMMVARRLLVYFVEEGIVNMLEHTVANLKRAIVCNARACLLFHGECLTIFVAI